MKNIPHNGEEKLRHQVEQLADQLAGSISGNFDFSVFTEDAGYSMQKLSIMVNFLLQKIREHLKESAASRAYVESVIASMNDMVVITDSGYLVKSVGGILAKKLKVNDRAFVGKPIDKVFPEMKGNDFGKAEFEIESFIASDCGRRFPILVSAARIISGDENRTQSCGDMVFTAKDLTKHKELESEVLRVSEREQRRVSYNLHDGVGQGLTGIAYMCEALSKRLEPVSIESARAMVEIKELINQCIGQTKSLAKDLYPIELERNGLTSVLESLVSNASDLFKINCKLDFSADSLFITDFPRSSHLYFIAQEALSNAIRHGKAKNITITFRSENGHISLIIDDDGVGIDSNLKNKKGMGLQIMSYRAHNIGCSLNIESQSERGTIIYCFN